MIITLFEQRCIACGIKLKILKVRVCPGLCSWTLTAITCVLVTQRDIRLTNTEEDRQNKEEEAIWTRCRGYRGVATLQATPGATSSWRKQGIDCHPRPFQSSTACPRFDIRLLTSRSIREYISAVLSHTVCGVWYSSHRKLITNSNFISRESCHLQGEKSKWKSPINAVFPCLY